MRACRTASRHCGRSPPTSSAALRRKLALYTDAARAALCKENAPLHLAARRGVRSSVPRHAASVGFPPPSGGLAQRSAPPRGGLRSAPSPPGRGGNGRVRRRGMGARRPLNHGDEPAATAKSGGRCEAAAMGTASWAGRHGSPSFAAARTGHGHGGAGCPPAHPCADANNMARNERPPNERRALHCAKRPKPANRARGMARQRARCSHASPPLPCRRHCPQCSHSARLGTRRGL